MFNNGASESDTRISVSDGKDTWGYAHTHTPGGISIKEFTDKSVHGTIKGPLHNSDPNNHKTISATGDFAAAING